MDGLWLIPSRTVTIRWGDWLHALISKTMILDLIIEEIYAEDELNYLLEQEESLNILYKIINERL